jgi:hypothetical protein
VRFLFLIALFSLFSTSFANAQVARFKPFELWPATNDAAPTTYTKAALPFKTDGVAWRFPYGPKVDVKIDATQVLRYVNPYDFGNNAAWYASKDWFLDPDRIEKAKEAGIKFWRWPGGSSSDNYFWDGNNQGHTTDKDGGDIAHMTQSWAVLTDDFIKFCKETGSEAIFTANYSASRYGSVQEAADLAARWVKHCNVDMGFKVRYWEIGNELYGPWEEGNTIPGKPQLTGDYYGKDFGVIADAMKAADPDIYVGAVCFEKPGEGEWVGHHDWTSKLLPQLNGKADFLILHQYFMWPFDTTGKIYSNPSNQVLFGNLPELESDRASLEKMVDANAPQYRDLPVALTEFNLVNTSPKPSIELLNGLFTAEVLGEAIKANYACADYWDWKNNYDKTYGGDMAMLSFNDPAVPDNTCRPSYYSYALYYRAFGDKMIACDSSEATVKVYASRFSGGELGLVIVNENDEARTMNFDFTGFTPKGQLMGWVLTGKDMNGTQVSWNGSEGPTGGGGPFPIDTIPNYRAKFDPGKPLLLPIAAHSATGVIIY